jgi:hypothetical protein
MSEAGMKITLEFDDKNDALIALRGIDYKLALDDIDGFLRSKIKYSDLPADIETALQEVRDQIHTLTSNIMSED